MKHKKNYCRRKRKGAGCKSQNAVKKTNQIMKREEDSYHLISDLSLKIFPVNLCGASEASHT